MSVERQVVFVMEVGDKPGIVHSIASVFAHRGLSIHGLVADTGGKPQRILVVFEGTPRQQVMVERVLERLHHVNHLSVVPATSPQLRAFAVCRVLAALPAFDDVLVQLDGDRALLSGSYAAVDEAITQLVQAGLIAEISRSLVAL